MAQINKKAALKISSQLDHVAEHIASNFSDYNIPERIASDFAAKCDKLADHIEKQAGIEPSLVTASEIQKEIGKEVPGPLVGLPGFKGEFTQQEFSELEGVVKKQASVLFPLSKLASAYAAVNNAVLANKLPFRDLRAANDALVLASQVLAKAAEAEDGDEDEVDGEDSGEEE